MVKLADELAAIASKKRSNSVEAQVKALTAVAITKAKKMADDGGFSCRFYDKRLEDSEVVKHVKSALKEQGFKVNVTEDTAFTQHAGSVQIYMELSW
jgi:N-dimethylarginine dimethylaminohydrolase